MKVILLQTVDRLGKAGDVVTVKEGYARNFLIPHGLAIPAEKTSLRNLDKKLKAKAEGSEAEKAELRRRRIGFVFQFDSLLPEFTVLENVDMPARIAGRYPYCEPSAAGVHAQASRKAA